MVGGRLKTEHMKKVIKFSLICLFLFIISQPVIAGDILEPELFEIVDAWLTSEPQPGIDYHVLRVCEDEDMSADCTQCMYKAKSDGAVKVNTYLMMPFGKFISIFPIIYNPYLLQLI
jgi:hypothetical protein